MKKSAVLITMLGVLQFSTGVFAYDGFILEDSVSRYLSRSDVAGMTAQEVCYAKNEIYARHGRKFQSQELKEYFGQQDWYEGWVEPNDFSELVFNAYEKENVMFLSNMEQSMVPGGYVLNKTGYDVYSVLIKYDKAPGWNGYVPGDSGFNDCITEEMAYMAVRMHIEDRGMDMSTIYNYNGYLNFCGNADGIYVFDFRSYTGTHEYFYVDCNTGRVDVSVQNGITMEYEPAIYAFDVSDYMSINPYGTGNYFDNNGQIDQDTIDSMKVGFVEELGNWCRLDLNGDGVEETISLSMITSETTYDGRRFLQDYTVTVNDRSLDNTGDWVEENLYGVSLDGRSILIFTQDYGPSDDPVCTFYRYDGQQLRCIGSIEDWADDLEIAGSSIFAALDCRVLETARRSAIFRCDTKGDLYQLPQAYYEYIPLSPGRNLQLISPLILFTNKDFSSTSLTIMPQRVEITYTDAEDWIYLEGADGTCGWLYLKNMDFSERISCFNGLNFAD